MTPPIPETDSSTGQMVLGVQCGCRVVDWKDGGHAIEPCPLHGAADELLEMLSALVLHFGTNPRPGSLGADLITSARILIDKAGQS